MTDSDRKSDRPAERPWTKGFDLGFRPDTYWTSDLARGAHRGEARRRAERGGFDALAAAPVPFALTGGNYLQEMESGELEIAHISLDSTTWDAISIRARRDGGVIRYRIVDEYELDEPFGPGESKLPLALGELIDGLEARGESPRELREAGCTVKEPGDVPEVKEFVRVSSDFYPDLERCYEREAEAWAEEKLEELALSGGGRTRPEGRAS